VQRGREAERAFKGLTIKKLSASSAVKDFDNTGAGERGKIGKG
jgi:hypothetical protein